jgi:hypothetical protein
MISIHLEGGGDGYGSGRRYTGRDPCNFGGERVWFAVPGAGAVAAWRFLRPPRNVLLIPYFILIPAGVKLLPFRYAPR